jgi:pSer/pThr/pTyr-binding forkhead associated (FHA) protein
MVDVRSDPVGPVVWIPSVTWKSIRYPLTRASTIIGRGTESDVHVVAPGVSRHHAEIRWNGKRSEVVDLGSTNGTTLDGESITRAALPDSCTLGVGQARIVFQVVPLTRGAYDALVHTPADSAEETS